MPPKRRKKLKGRVKEEMLVTSRLMSISLVVDDYIYKNKPISLLEAMKYDEEITSFKIKCDKYPRSLQVVEKLKIFMKSIINEQTDRLQDNTSSSVTDTCVDNNALTLNYISEVHNITNNPQAKTTELFSDRENQFQLNIKQNLNTKKDNINIINTEICVKDSEIKIVEPNIITPYNSILKLNDKEENVMCASKNIDFAKSCLDNPINEKEPARSDLSITSLNLLKPLEQEKTCLIKENLKPDEINRIKKRRKQINLKKNNIKTKTNKNMKKVNKPKKIEKKKTQINLSWVENMKYVREVSPDEHTNLQIEESFWNNLALPGIWNPNEFD